MFIYSHCKFFYFKLQNTKDGIKPMKKQKVSNEELTFKINEDWIFENQNLNHLKAIPVQHILLIINNGFHFEFDVIVGSSGRDAFPLDSDSVPDKSGYDMFTFKKNAVLPQKIVKLTKPVLKNILKELDTLDRMDEVWNLINAYNQLLLNRKNCIDGKKNVAKEDFKIQVCGGATGIGKTKLLYVMRSIFSNPLYFADVKPVFLTFSSATPYEKSEHNLSMEESVNARIACELGQYTGIDALRKAFASNRLDLNDLFPDTPKVIVLLIDEFNSIPDPKLSEFVEYCGKLMTPAPKKPFIIIITAGTLPGKLKDIFTQSKCPGQLKPISALKMETMIKDLNTDHKSVRKEMYRVLQDICGIPRLYNTLKREAVLPTTYDKGIGILLSHSNIPGQPPSVVLDVVVPFALLEYPVLTSTVFWDNYISKGHAFLYPIDGSPNSLVKFPFYWLNRRTPYYGQLSDEWSYLISQLYWRMDAYTNGLVFENIASMWISLRTWLFSKLSNQLGRVQFSEYIGIDHLRNLDFDVKMEATHLYSTRSQITKNGIEGVCLWGTEETVELALPFIVNCASNQCGIDAVQTLFDSQGNLILVFYQFKCYQDNPSKAAKKLEISFKLSVEVIDQVSTWISKTFNKKVHKCFYLAVVNYCNDPVIPTEFQTLIDHGLSYHFIQGSKCRQFMTSTLCERNSIWTRGDKLLINIAPYDAIKMLPNVGVALAKQIKDALDISPFHSIQDLISRVENNGKKLGKSVKKSLSEYLIF